LNKAVKKDVQTLEELAGPKSSGRKRFFGFLSLLGSAMAMLELGKFLYLRQPIYAGMGCVWLTVAVAWGYRYRHFGESQLKHLDTKTSK
jgi:hypothetical protein